MSDTFTSLPVEIRYRIYELLFAGKELSWTEEADEEKRADCISIRLVSKQCLAESEHIFFRTTQLDITKLIHKHYRVFIPAIDARLLQNVVLYLPSVPWTAKNSRCGAARAIDHMPNLRKFTFFCSDNEYDFTFPDFRTDGTFGQKAQSFIQRLPWRILGGNDDLDEPFHFGDLPHDVQYIITTWEKRERAFELYSENEIGYGNGIHYGTGRLDLNTKIFQIEYDYYPEITTDVHLDRLTYEGETVGTEEHDGDDTS